MREDRLSAAVAADRQDRERSDGIQVAGQYAQQEDQVFLLDVQEFLKVYLVPPFSGSGSASVDLAAPKTNGRVLANAHLGINLDDRPVLVDQVQESLLPWQTGL